MKKDFYVKNMVCNRCIKVLKDEFNKAKMDISEIELGRVCLDIADVNDVHIVNTILEKNGFELISSTEEKLVEQVKTELIKLFEPLPLNYKENLSAFLARKLQMEYSKISKLFSIEEGITIEKYFIKLKIEKVKELIQTPKYNFTEISQLLDYSNINHLSRQFKNETGMSLTEYRNGHINSRHPLDKII